MTEDILLAELEVEISTIVRKYEEIYASTDNPATWNNEVDGKRVGDTRRYAWYARSAYSLALQAVKGKRRKG